MSDATSNKNYSVDLPRHQYFSFPPDVIKHLWKNPKSGNVLRLLHQTCKYFFSKQRILVLCKHEHAYLKDNTFYYSIFTNKKLFQNSFKIEKVKAFLWPTYDLVIEHPLPISFDKIYRCSVNRLVIDNTTLSFTQFELLVTENTVKECNFGDSSIFYSNGGHVTLDVVLQKLRKVENFWYKNRNETYTAETLQKMVQQPLCENLNYCFFYLVNIANNFDPLLLSQFYQKYPSCSFKLYIINQRSYEIRALMETELKRIFENSKNEKLAVAIYAQGVF